MPSFLMENTSVVQRKEGKLDEILEKEKINDDDDDSFTYSNC